MASRLRKLSYVLGWAATLWVLTLPVLLALSLIYEYPVGPMDIRAYLPALLSRVPDLYRFSALSVSLIPAGFTLWAWWSLRNLMFLYAKGDVFGEAPLHQLRNIALALLCSVVAGIMLHPVSNLILNWPFGPSHRNLAAVISTDDIAEIFKAGVVYVVALVMSEARRLADENARFV